VTDHIKIIQPGILSTLQDGGRIGYAAIGVGPGGVMDQYAYHAANRLLGNPSGSCVIEMHFPAPIMECNTDITCCLTGADFNALLNDSPLAPWQTFQVKKGDILQFKNKSRGFRCYLGIQGGFKGDQWLGSYSTNMILKMGGFKGRRLQKGDLIPLENAEQDNVPQKGQLISAEDYAKIYDDRNDIVCLPGPEWNQLDSDTKEILLKDSFSLSVNSNRMACLLENKNHTINFPNSEMLSSAVLMGTVQLLPSGSLAILMADHQTTGGFPRILQVLQSQIPQLAQMSPGSELRFRMTDPEAAAADFLSFMTKCSDGKIL
jgi:antagonist of KipI